MTRKNDSTRRGLLRGLAVIGGVVAAYQTISLPQAVAAPLPDASANLGNGKHVVVLGAGVGGICAAYELEKLGYRVTVLESSERAGGRSLTLRHGDQFQEMGGDRQTCTFKDNGWLNAGPGRIPHHHVNVVNYCRQLGVTLEPYIFNSRANLTTRGMPVGEVKQPVTTGRISNDLRGQVALLLDQCMKKSGATDSTDLSAMLKEFGGLTLDANKDPPLTYVNREGRAGYIHPPGLLIRPPLELPPLSMNDLLKSKVWEDSVFRETRYYWQSSLMQPVGGMDMFWKGFLRQKLRQSPTATVASLIRYHAQVKSITLTADKVMIGIAGREHPLAADYCVSTIPMPIFAGLQSNLDQKYKDAVAAIPITPAGKVGWQAERFWEKDPEIFGGISWVDGLADQVWYPSDGFLTPLGVLTGAYMTGDKATKFNAKPISERMNISRDAIERLHPGSRAMLKDGVAIAWEKMEHIQMGFVNENEAAFKTNAPIVSEAQGKRLFQAGDQLTYLSGWKEGAILTAKLAVQEICKHTSAG